MSIFIGNYQYYEMKYLLIALINAFLLFLLLFLSLDGLALKLGQVQSYKFVMTFFKIIGINLLYLCLNVILLYVLKKNELISNRKKVAYSILLAFFLSAYFYVGCTKEYILNKWINRTLRTTISAKIEPTHILQFGTKADSLSWEEIQELKKNIYFPPIPPTAKDISYQYSYDGFLPDFEFELIYFVPLSQEIKEIQIEERDYNQSQKVEILGDMKKVRYEEGQM